jgi:hypothetical protein
MSDSLPPPQLPGLDPPEPPVTTINVIKLTPAPPGAGPATVTLPDGTRLVQGPDGVFVADPAPPPPPDTAAGELPPPHAELPPPEPYPFGTVPVDPSPASTAPVAVHSVLGFKGLLATLATLSTVAIVAIAVTRSDDPPVTVPAATTIAAAVTIPPKTTITAAVTIPPAGATVPAATISTATISTATGTTVAATALPETTVSPATTVAPDGGPAIALIVSTIDYCLSLSSFTDVERAQVKGELSFSASPTANPDVWVVTITNVGAARDGDWTVDVATGDITPVMPFGANSIYFDMQWCMQSDTLGVG